jgi:uncharacterized protein YukE
MSTDPALAGVLATAAGRVERVGEQLAAVDIRLATAGVSILFSWHGSAHDRFTDVVMQLQAEAAAAAQKASTLASVLRSASGSAAERVRVEAAAAAAAALAKQQADAAKAAAAKAAAQQPGARR